MTGSLHRSFPWPLAVSLALLTFCTMPSPATAAPTRFDLYAGLGIPESPSVFPDAWNSGFSGALALGIQVNPRLAVLGTIDYSNFAFDEQLVDGGSRNVIVEGGAISLTYLSAAVEFVPAEFREAGKFFLLGGVGYYHIYVDDLYVDQRQLADWVVVGSTPSADERALGFQVGTGIRLQNFLVQVGYLLGLTEGASTGHATLRAGYSFAFVD